MIGDNWSLSLICSWMILSIRLLILVGGVGNRPCLCGGTSSVSSIGSKTSPKLSGSLCNLCVLCSSAWASVSGVLLLVDL